uniref:VM domain-containing protein n=1 Tax=Glossina austeni TaxID=7395 RepID=A0A1A9UJB9_GLOAU
MFLRDNSKVDILTALRKPLTCFFFKSTNRENAVLLTLRANLFKSARLVEDRPTRYIFLYPTALIKMQLNLLMIFGLIIQFHDLATVGAQLPCPNNYLFGCQAVLQPVPCEQGPPVAALPLTLPIPIQLLSSLTQAQPFPQLQSIYHHLLASLGHPTPICRSAKGLLHLQPSRSLSNKDSLDDEVNNKQ